MNNHWIRRSKLRRIEHVDKSRMQKLVFQYRFAPTADVRLELRSMLKCMIRKALSSNAEFEFIVDECLQEIRTIDTSTENAYARFAQIINDLADKLLGRGI